MVRPLDVLLVGEALAPRLAVVAEKGERRLLAETEIVQRLQEGGEDRLGFALDGLRVALEQSRARLHAVGLDPGDDLRLGRLPFPAP